AWADDPRADPEHRTAAAIPPAVHRASLLDPVTHALLGAASWHAVEHGGCAAWKIRITPYSSGDTTAAYRLLTDHLFATTPIDRIEATASADDSRTRQALEGASFRFEGVLRSGAATDLVLYGLLRADR
ncbi:MAG TPA: GNAT family protein, partial [Actinophytocola sp.]